MNKLLNVSSSPHVRSSVTTQNLMLDVVIAMIPAAAFGVFHFGLHALLVMIVTVAACVASEYVYEKFMNKPITIMDMSAVVTGTDPGAQYAAGNPAVDPGAGRGVRHHRGKAALRRSGTELYEPGSGGPGAFCLSPWRCL